MRGIYFFFIALVALPVLGQQEAVNWHTDDFYNGIYFQNLLRGKSTSRVVYDDNDCPVRRGSAFPKLEEGEGLEKEFSNAILEFDAEYRSIHQTIRTIELRRELIELRKEYEATKLAENVVPQALKDRIEAKLGRMERWERTYHRFDFCEKELRPYSGALRTQLEKLAKKGYEPAFWWLSVIYEYGVGTEVDLVEAYAWRAVGVALHRPFGQNRLDELAEQLNVYELNQAEDLAFRYMKTYTSLFDGPTQIIWGAKN